MRVIQKHLLVLYDEIEVSNQKNTHGEKTMKYIRHTMRADSNATKAAASFFETSLTKPILPRVTETFKLIPWPASADPP